MAQRRRSSIFRHNPKIAPNQSPNTDEQINPQVTKETSDSLRAEGCELAKNGTPEDLKKAIEKFSKVKPLTDDIFYLRGNAHLKLGGPKHNQKAVDDFTKVINLSNNAKSPPVHSIVERHYKRAFAYQMLGDNDHAIRDYSLFIKHAKGKGSDVEAKGFLSRGLVYESMQLMQKALEDIDQAIKLTHEKNPYYEYCRERVHAARSEKNDDPDDEDGSIAGSTHDNGNGEENDDDERFKNDADHISSEKPTGLEIQDETPNTKYEKIFYDALLHSEQGKSEEALRKFKAAFDIATNELEKADSKFREGLCQYELGQKVEAESTFRKVLQHNPKHARAIFRLGLIQATDGQLKDAIKNLSLAYKYAPNHVDILHERANVFEKLGRLNDAMYDRRRAMQLVQSTPNMIVEIEDRIRYIKAEVIQKGESAIRHFKIGWLQEALHKYRKTVTYLREENGKIVEKTEQDNSAYKEAVSEYKAAIYVDGEDFCPEARALLGLCQYEEKDILPGCDVFQTLFKMFENSPDSVQMWKSFVKNIRNINFWIEMGTPPSERMLKQVQEVERDRNEIVNDEKSFKGKGKENLLSFYRTFRVELSNALAAFALAGCNEEIIAHNLKKGSYSKAASAVSITSKVLKYIPHVGSTIEATGGQIAKFIEDKDHELIRNKLKMISKCGDITEQIEVARRVARRLTDRYKDQLSQLDIKFEEVNADCCSCCKSIISCILSSDEREFEKPAERVATFAVNYIVSAVADENIKLLKLRKANDKDALVQMLLELACRAPGPKSCLPKCYHDDPKLYLPLTPKFNTNLSTEKQLSHNENQNTTDNMNTTITSLQNQSTPETSQSEIERFCLYDFFRAPGLHCVPEEDRKSQIKDQKQQTSYEPINQQENKENEEELINQNDENQVKTNKCLTSNDDEIKIEDKNKGYGEKWSDLPYMNPKDYGYRLCNSIELRLFKQDKQDLVERVCCINSCC